MENQEIATGILEFVRGAFTKVAELLSGFVPFPAENIYVFLFIMVALFTAAKLTAWLPRIRDSWGWWLALAAGIFYLLYFV